MKYSRKSLAILIFFAILFTATVPVLAEDMRISSTLYSAALDVNVGIEIVGKPFHFAYPDAEKSKQPDLVKKLFKIKGVCSVSLKPYTISLTTAKVYPPAEIAPQAEKIVQTLPDPK